MFFLTLSRESGHHIKSPFNKFVHSRTQKPLQSRKLPTQGMISFFLPIYFAIIKLHNSEITLAHRSQSFFAFLGDRQFSDNLFEILFFPTKIIFQYLSQNTVYYSIQKIFSKSVFKFFVWKGERSLIFSCLYFVWCTIHVITFWL